MNKTNVNSEISAAAGAVALYNTNNSNVLTVLKEEFINKTLKNNTYNTIRNAIETLEKNELKIDGFTKWDYDKDCAIKELKLAMAKYTELREHINNAMNILEDDNIALVDVVTRADFE